MTDPDHATNPIADLTDLLDQLTGTPPTPQPPAAPAADSSPPVFRDVDHFLRGYLAHVVERRLSTGSVPGIYWCPRWWAHPEAISRLYALWRAWETLRVADPQTGMSIWWRDHLDPHLAALTSEYGPLSRCRPDRHTAPKPLPMDPAPADVLAHLPNASDD